MQVFVPYTTYIQSVACLDNARLNKQILEATQLLDIMFDIPTKTGKPRTGWLNHPALIAWKNNPGALIEYTQIAISEAALRGFNTAVAVAKVNSYPSADKTRPVWWGDEKVHKSHQARLLQKGFEAKLKGHKNADAIIDWYRSQNFAVMNDSILMAIDYSWPVNITNDSYDLEVRATKDAAKTKLALIQQFGLNPYR